MHLILGTAGHIDHGKSSLIKALSGTDPDRLPEEKSRGVTIELGFAHLSIDDFEIGLIDVPGHADFINNMVSGVGALDIALFIVAADDGWMPQSEEHLQILNYLGIDEVIIVLTKSDLADDLDFTIELVREELAGTSLEEAPILPVSSHTGAGLDALKQEICRRAKVLQASPKHHIPRLSVDRAFSPTGVGTVVTGTLTGQPIHKGDTLVCLPEGISVSVRNVQNHQRALETSMSGMRTALNLPDLPLKSRGKPGVSRGSVITTPDLITPSQTLDIWLQRDARPIPGQSATKRDLKNTETVILHHGTSRTRARVILQDRSTLAPGESCFAQLRLESPIAACTSDRIVLRDGAQQGTLGGGIILDATAQARGFRSDARARFLELRNQDPGTLRALILSELSKSPAVPAKKPVANSPFTADFLQQTVEKLAKEKKAVLRGSYLLAPAWWKSITETAGQIVDQWHRDFSDAPSMPIEEWRKQLRSQGAPSGLLETLEAHLIQHGYSKQKDGIANAEHALELPERLQPEADRIRRTLDSSGITPPPRVELAPTDDAKQALSFLIRSGEVVELDPKALLAKQHYQALRQAIIDFLTQTDNATASDIRQHTGSTRKFLVPILEQLDAEGVTERDGDLRRLAR